MHNARRRDALCGVELTTLTPTLSRSRERE
jgi:hypothetical protein